MNSFFAGWLTASIMWLALAIVFDQMDNYSEESMLMQYKAYRQCIDDQYCRKDVEFYIQYYRLKWRLQDANLIS